MKIKSSKNGKLITQHELKTSIIQPNRITSSIFEGFTLIDHKVFSAIMLNLQEAIQLEMKNKDYTQLNMFRNFDNCIKFNLSLKDITNDPTAYNAVRMTILGMSQKHVKIPIKGDDGQDFYFVSSFLTALIPKVANYKTHIPIKIEMTIAKFLIVLERNALNRVNQFTKYHHEIVKTARSVYTIQIYKLICAWKEQEYFSIFYNDLRDVLSIGKKYSSFQDFKRNVIIVAQNELFENDDTWFSIDEKNFKIMKTNAGGLREIYLTFKIHNLKRIKAKTNRSDVINLLRIHFNFNENHLNEINHILEDENIPSDVIRKKITMVHEAIYMKSKSDPVKNLSAYMKEALLNVNWYAE